MPPLGFQKQPAMENTNICKLAVSIAFSLLAATPIAASSTTPAIVDTAIPAAAIPLEHDLHLRQADTTTIVTGPPPTCIILDSVALLITRQHVTGENVCILINGN